MYRFHYDWNLKGYTGFAYRVESLYRKSLDNCPSNEENKLTELFLFYENYFAGLLRLGYLNKNNSSNILNQLNSIKLIKLLDGKYRDKINGLSYRGVIEINPEPGCFYGLNQEETYELSMYHELGHIITASNNDNLYELTRYLKKIYSDVVEDDFEYFAKGFELLDEVVVENVGENIFFNKRGLNRPDKNTLTSKSLYPDGYFTSNFVEYREFQEVAERFVSCLDLAKDWRSDSLLDNYSKEMFKKGFYKKLFNEFIIDYNKGEDLIRMLICMGKIKEAKYSTFGLGNMKDRDVSSSFNEIINISNNYSLQDKNKIQS